MDELEEVIADAWLARAPTTVAAKWLAERGLSTEQLSTE